MKANPIQTVTDLAKISELLDDFFIYYHPNLKPLAGYKFFYENAKMYVAENYIFHPHEKPNTITLTYIQKLSNSELLPISYSLEFTYNNESKSYHVRTLEDKESRIYPSLAALIANYKSIFRKPVQNTAFDSNASLANIEPLLQLPYFYPHACGPDKGIAQIFLNLPTGSYYMCGHHRDGNDDAMISHFKNRENGIKALNSFYIKAIGVNREQIAYAIHLIGEKGELLHGNKYYPSTDAFIETHKAILKRPIGKDFAGPIQTKPYYLTELPDEILLNIFSFFNTRTRLGKKDFQTLATTNKQFHRLSQDSLLEKTLWATGHEEIPDEKLHLAVADPRASITDIMQEAYYRIEKNPKNISLLQAIIRNYACPTRNIYTNDKDILTDAFKAKTLSFFKFKEGQEAFAIERLFINALQERFTSGEQLTYRDAYNNRYYTWLYANIFFETAIYQLGMWEKRNQAKFYVLLAGLTLYDIDKAAKPINSIINVFFDGLKLPVLDKDDEEALSKQLSKIRSNSESQNGAPLMSKR